MLNRVYQIILFLNLLFFVLPMHAATVYKIDPEHTYVSWRVSHFGFSMQTGKWFAEGNIQLDPAKIEQSKVTAVIKLNNLVTGIPELDKHLLGKLFFDVEKYPTSTFVSNKIIVTGKNTAKIAGILVLHGISKLIWLDVRLNKHAMSPIKEKDTLGFSASTVLNRQDFDISTLSPGIGDKVKIEIEGEAYKV